MIVCKQPLALRFIKEIEEVESDPKISAALIMRHRRALVWYRVR
jgi:hypothetical protein